MKKSPRFTIVTVCYNAEDLLSETVNSLLSQSFTDYEYIIKDGQSTDLTMVTAKNLLEGSGLCSDSYQMISTPDKGIFDAMNQAVSYARGEYVYFLNAGDRFADADVLQKVSDHIDSHQEADIVFGNVYEEFEDKVILRRYGIRNTKKWYYALGACLNHQTMFCKRNLFEEKEFDVSFPTTADREWQMYFILSAKKKVLYADVPIAVYLRGGFSEKNILNLEKETAISVKRYCGLWNLQYILLSFVKKNKLLHQLITKAEAMMNTKTQK